jgi:uncharacterized membrane protein
MGDELVILIQLDDRRWFSAIMPHSSIETLTPPTLYATGALFLIILIIVSFLCAASQNHYLTLQARLINLLGAICLPR